MSLERLLQINIAALVAMGSLLLGMGQANRIVPLLAVGSALTSLMLTDIWRLVRLNTMVANIAGIVAVVVCLSDFFEYDHRQQQLLAVANLLVYLQMVLLFQEKNNRLYGHLLVLSLLQVVVASALGLDLHFGVMLIVYMFAALTALYLLFFHRELLQHGAVRWRTSDGGGPSDTSGATISAVTQDEPGMQAGSTYVQLARELTISGLLKCVLTMGFSTLIIAWTLFFAIPRVGTSEWHSEVAGSREIAFAPEVTLNETGSLRRSQERVMRINFFDARTDEPYVVVGEPYFRGTVLWDYSSDNDVGRWSKGDLGVAEEYVHLRAAPVGKFLVRQEIVLEPRRDQLLFSVFPFYQDEQTPNEIDYNVRKRQLTRKRDDQHHRPGEFRYSLSTTTFVSGWQDPIVGHSNRLDGQENAWELEREMEQLLKVKSEGLSQLKKLADEVIAGTVSRDRVLQARALESHLRNSGLYRYETDFTQIQAQRKPGVDPIEAFVSDHRAGHCEYFASALAIMLRTQGIPSRLVVGYMGGEYNTFGKYFTVREEHAHAWVEAYLEPDQIPVNFRTNDASPSGAWLRLDPTPPGDSMTPIAASRGALGRVGQWVDYTQLLWTEYVVGLNSERQYKSIYRPLVQQVGGFLRMLFGREMWRNLLERFFRLRWFNWRAGLVTGAVLLVLVGMHRLLRDPLQQAWEAYRASRRPVQTHAGPRVAFYDHMESLLARHGWQRATGQTQHEFARDVGGQLADQPRHQSVASLPRRVVDAFYRVRFGGQVLNADESLAVEQSLTALNDVLTVKNDE